AAEFTDVSENRQHFKILSSNIGGAGVTVNFGGGCPFRARNGDGCAQVPSDWLSVYIDNGSTQKASGVDQVTAMYRPAEGGWKLCGSDFKSNTTTSALKHAFIR